MKIFRNKKQAVALVKYIIPKGPNTYKCSDDRQQGRSRVGFTAYNFLTSKVPDEW